MSDFPNFSKNSSDMYRLFIEVDKYKSYVLSLTDPTASLTKDTMFNGEHLTLFAVEIFQFWLEAIKVKSDDKLVFLSFASRIGIPVRDHDLGEEGLSWFGQSVYAIWCEAVRSRND